MSKISIDEMQIRDEEKIKYFTCYALAGVYRGFTKKLPQFFTK